MAKTRKTQIAAMLRRRAKHKIRRKEVRRKQKPEYELTDPPRIEPERLRDDR